MNVRAISLTAMLAAMLFVFTSIRIVIPVPMGLVGLYIFRRFERDAVKALFISDILQVFFLVFAFFDLFVMFTWMFSVAQDWIISVMLIRDSFTFKNFTLFHIGSITALPFIIFAIVATWATAVPMVASTWDYSMILLIVGTHIGTIVAFLLIYFCGGVSMILGFGIVKKFLDRGVIKLEIFDQIIGDSMNEKVDEEGGILNVPWDV